MDIFKYPVWFDDVSPPLAAVLRFLYRMCRRLKSPGIPPRAYCLVICNGTQKLRLTG